MFSNQQVDFTDSESVSKDDTDIYNGLSEEEYFKHHFGGENYDQLLSSGLTQEELSILSRSPGGVEMLLAQQELDYHQSIIEIEGIGEFN